METSDTRHRLSEWIRAVDSLEINANNLRDPLGSYVDTVFLSALKARSNQVVNGRRGAGKTHLFRTLEAELLTRLDELQLLPVYINGQQLRQQTSILHNDPTVVALGIYVEFIKSITEHVNTFLNSQVSDGWLEKLFGSAASANARKAQQAADRLYSLLEAGQVRILPSGTASTEARTVNEVVEQVSASTGISFNLTDPRTIGWKLAADVGTSGSDQHSEVSTLSLKGDVILPFNEVSVKLQELLATTEASLFVLFDEWSDIPLEVQPFLADMMKRTFATIGSMYVKLGCIPGRTQLATPITTESPTPLGYEEGDDIVVDINLDQVVFADNDLDQLLPFFTLLLKRHIGLDADWVRTSSEEEFTSFLATSAFVDDRVFAELCHASGGIPRDFLTLLKAATRHARDGQIDLRHVRQSARTLYESKLHSFDGSSSQGELDLLRRIYRHVVAGHSCLCFLVGENLVSDHRITKLFMEKLIHRLPLSYYDSATHKRYLYFLLDYTTSVDFISSLAADAKERIMTSRALVTRMEKQESPEWLKAVGMQLMVSAVKNNFKAVLAPDKPLRMDIDPASLIVDSLMDEERDSWVGGILKRLPFLRGADGT